MESFASTKYPQTHSYDTDGDGDGDDDHDYDYRGSYTYEQEEPKKIRVLKNLNDHVCLLNIIAWIYGFSVFFLFCLTIFPEVHKLYTIAFSAQIIYALFLVSLANHDTLRHNVTALIFSVPFLAINAAVLTVFLAKIIEFPDWLGLKFSHISGADHTAISWGALIVFILIIMDLCIIGLCFRKLSIYRSTHNLHTISHHMRKTLHSPSNIVTAQL